MSRQNKQKLLLHICCIGCGIGVVDELEKEFDVTLFFYNPNIFPIEEFDRRLEEIERITKNKGLKIIVQRDEDYSWWRERVRGLETEPEKGARCKVCYSLRLRKTLEYGRKNGFDVFGTTLTISPHKDSDIINEIGQTFQKHFQLKYFDKDFKKEDGFKKSCRLSKEFGLYRQNYCGCEFSIRKNLK